MPRADAMHNHYQRAGRPLALQHQPPQGQGLCALNGVPHLRRLHVLVGLLSGEGVLSEPFHEGHVGAGTRELVLGGMDVRVDQTWSIGGGRRGEVN